MNKNTLDWQADLIQNRLDKLTKPLGSLGLLEEFVKKLGLIQETLNPSISKRRIYVFAADHGITQEGVSAYPSDVTAQMVLNFVNGGAAINVLANQFNVDFKLVDVGVDHDFVDESRFISRKIAKGTKNFLKVPAMSRDQALAAINIGTRLAKECSEEGMDCLIAGEMGIGNTSSSSIIASILCGVSIEEVTGRGTGVSDEILCRKIEVLKKAMSVREFEADDILSTLSAFGGFEIAAIVGLALGCSKLKIPLIVDGFIAAAGIALAVAHNSGVRNVLFASHLSNEGGHRFLLDYLRLKPILDLEMRLGEGTGAILAIPIIEAAINLYNNMATFDDAGVDKKL